jgi:hypothetical protein
MYHASVSRFRARHRSHVYVFVWAWLNVGELPRFDNQLQHFSRVVLYLVILRAYLQVDLRLSGSALFGYVSAMRQDRAPRSKNPIKWFFSNLGPGLISGAADDDPSGIAT